MDAGSEKRMVNDNSITIRGSRWFDHSKQTGGGAISFVMNHYGLDYAHAVQLLLGSDCAAGSSVAPKCKPFSLPRANNNMRRLFAYLTQTRRIANEVVAKFVQLHLIYEEAEHHNAVFVGVDSSGTARHAHMRSTNTLGTTFRRNVDGSDSRYSFHYMGDSEKLYVFEAPIDLLSYITLHLEAWEQHSYVACCGTSIAPVLTILELMPRIHTVYLCLDNDPAGEEASKRMARQLTDRGLNPVRLKPSQKDWNDELVCLC